MIRYENDLLHKICDSLKISNEKNNFFEKAIIPNKFLFTNLLNVPKSKSLSSEERDKIHGKEFTFYKKHRYF